MNNNAKIDALQLMLTDLRTRNESIRHKAAFRGCQPEFQTLVTKLIEQLESQLNDEKQLDREKINSNR
jgi:mannose/fructose/N-acetylgalactosamine-specific phosphotransferase system component IID|tara:strand:+ start:199 stop:402 length:204 start_codon:yes stop_codon:yes gene_type:complete